MLFGSLLKREEIHSFNDSKLIEGMDRPNCTSGKERKKQLRQGVAGCSQLNKRHMVCWHGELNSSFIQSFYSFCIYLVPGHFSSLGIIEKGKGVRIED